MMKLSERIPPHINIRNEDDTDWVNARNEVAQLDAENAELKWFVRKVWRGRHHTAVDFTKSPELCKWVCDTMDEAAALLAAE